MTTRIPDRNALTAARLDSADPSDDGAESEPLVPGLVLLALLRFARAQGYPVDALASHLPPGLAEAARHGQRARWDDIALLFSKLERCAPDAIDKYAEFYVREIQTLVALYVASPDDVYRTTLHGWRRVWTMANFDARETTDGWDVTARIEPPHRECRAFLRLAGEILKRLPRMVGGADSIVESSFSAREATWHVRLVAPRVHADGPAPQAILSTIREQMFSFQQAEPRIPARWGLTSTEGRVVLSIASGTSVRATARALGITHETARTHLKRAMAKAGVHRQAELVRRVLDPGLDGTAPPMAPRRRVPRRR